MIRIKICGVTREEDALHAAALGADLIGMVFARSARRVSVETAARIGAVLEEAYPDVARVGVFVDPSPDDLERAVDESRLTHLQVHGRIPERLPPGIPWIGAIALSGPQDVRAPSGDPWAILVEPRVEGGAGGTGQVFPWEWARDLIARRRVLIAGGLDADRAADLLRIMRPYGLDASSRLESSPGVKDPQRVRAFIEAVRRAGVEEGD